MILNVLTDALQEEQNFLRIASLLDGTCRLIRRRKMRVDVNDVVLRIGDDGHVALAQRRMLQHCKSRLILNLGRLHLRGQISINHLLANLSGDVVAQEADFAAFGERTEQTEQRTEKLLFGELRTLANVRVASTKSISSIA